MRVKEQSEKVCLKFSIIKTSIMASGPITSWQMQGEYLKQWQILFSWAPKSLHSVTAAMKFPIGNQSWILFGKTYAEAEAQAGIKIAGRNINNLRYADDTTLMAESKEELKSFLMRVKEQSEKSGLKLNIQKAKIMASGPITPWQVDGKKWKQWQIFIFLGSKTTADSDCTCEVKRHLLLGRKPMTNIASVLKGRDMTLPTKVHMVKTMVFPVVMYGCESWTTQQAEHQKIDAFKLWCWRRVLRVLWTARRSN